MKSKNLFYGIIILGMIMFVVISCKKDIINDYIISKEQKECNISLYKEEGVLNFNNEFKYMLNSADHFIKKYELYKKRGLRSDSIIKIDDAIKLYDFLLNYQYGDNSLYCNNTTIDTLHFEMPKQEKKGYLYEHDVFSLYDNLRTKFDNYTYYITDGMQTVRYFVINYYNGEGNILLEDSLEILVSRGFPGTNNNPQGPFTPEDNWVWGGDYGYCDSIGITTSDAAQELSKRFKFHRLSLPGYKLVMWGVEMNERQAKDKINTEGCSEYWLFHVVSDNEFYCIEYDTMNCYWRSIYRNVVLEDGVFHYSNNYHSPYFECEIKAEKGNTANIKRHKAYITYCYYTWYKLER